MQQKNAIILPVISLMVLFSMLTNTDAQTPEEEALKKGDNYYQKQMYDEAIRELDKVIEINPNSYAAYCNRGLVYADKGNFNQAIVDFSKAIELKSGVPNFYDYRGNAYRNIGNVAQAISDCSKAIEINPQYAPAYNDRAIAYFINDDFDKSAADLKSAIKLGYNVHPEFVETLKARMAAKESGDFSEPWGFSLDERQWIIGYKQSTQNKRIIEYVLKGESVNNWSELITSLWAQVNDEYVAEKAADGFVDQLKRDCPQAEVHYIKKEQNNIVIEWKHDGCSGFPPQHEIKHFSKAKNIMYTLSYVKKTSGLSEKERTRWISAIGDAYIFQKTGK